MQRFVSDKLIINLLFRKDKLVFLSETMLRKILRNSFSGISFLRLRHFPTDKPESVFFIIQFHRLPLNPANIADSGASRLETGTPVHAENAVNIVFAAVLPDEAERFHPPIHGKICNYFYVCFVRTYGLRLLDMFCHRNSTGTIRTSGIVMVIINSHVIHLPSASSFL
jgi:hypothetical protein